MRNLEAFYQLQIREPSGLLVLNTGMRLAHSFTKGFLQTIFNVEAGGRGEDNHLTLTTTSGSSLTTYYSMTGSSGSHGLLTSASATGDTYGIQVGTGTTAESINNTALATKISHGTSAGTLQYGAVTYGAPSTTATTTTFRTTRVFTNGSGGTVTVQEIGLVSVILVLLLRDLTGAVAITNGQQLTVNYDFTTTI